MDIRVIVKEPGKLEEIKYIKDNLSAWQEIVGGYVEVVKYRKLYEKGIAILVNENGKNIGLGENLFLTDSKMKVKEVLNGNVIFYSLIGTDEDKMLESLTDEQILFLTSVRLVGLFEDGEKCDVMQIF